MWCPNHRWEFSNPGMTVCPSCGAELVAELPEAEPVAATHDPVAVPAGDEPEPRAVEEPSVRATRLDSFDRLVAPMLLDLLRERGIRAFEAEKPSNPITRGFEPMGTEIWVDASQLEEARRIAREDLPAFLAEAIPEETDEDEGSDDDDADDDDIEWSSFGWMETHVAIVFLEVCEEEAITARSDYPLDRPPPAWATPGMRVQMWVDALFVEEAEALLARVEERLDERGISWEDPLCDLSGP